MAEKIIFGDSRASERQRVSVDGIHDFAMFIRRTSGAANRDASKEKSMGYGSRVCPNLPISALQMEMAGAGLLIKAQNTGAIPSDEVPQVYLGPPAKQPKGVQFAVRSLSAFGRIHLDPGQSRDENLHVPLRICKAPPSFLSRTAACSEVFSTIAAFTATGDGPGARPGRPFNSPNFEKWLGRD